MLKNEKMNIKYILLVFTLFMSYKNIKGDLGFFLPIVFECNSTFPIEEDIYSADIKQIAEIAKDNRNSKCFSHCVFHKLNLADAKGNIKKPELFENIDKIMQEIPDYFKKNFTISPQLKTVISTFVELCDTNDDVKQETDPCNKFFNFFLCFTEDSDNLSLDQLMKKR